MAVSQKLMPAGVGFGCWGNEELDFWEDHMFSQNVRWLQLIKRVWDTNSKNPSTSTSGKGDGRKGGGPPKKHMAVFGLIWEISARNRRQNDRTDVAHLFHLKIKPKKKTALAHGPIWAHGPWPIWARGPSPKWARGPQPTWAHMGPFFGPYGPKNQQKIIK